MSRNRPDYRARAPFGTASQAPFYCATTCPRSSRPVAAEPTGRRACFASVHGFGKFPRATGREAGRGGAPQCQRSPGACPTCPAPSRRHLALTQTYRPTKARTGGRPAYHKIRFARTALAAAEPAREGGRRPGAARCYQAGHCAFANNHGRVKEKGLASIEPDRSDQIGDGRPIRLSS
jgi:hypothetical protein